jgi:hypothetical protein
MEITYMCVVDADVKYPLTDFIKEVRGYLADSHGWKSRGYSFREVKANPRCVIHLSSPREILEAGCKDPSLSCAELGGKHLRLNAMRWTTGAKKSELPLKDYRQYMVTHEMGHILGFDHVSCPRPGAPAPLMMQQTVGLGSCKPNTKLTDIDGRKK